MIDRNETQKPAEMRELSTDEIAATSGAGIISFLCKVGRVLKDVLDGPGDQRRPTDRPS